MCARFKSWWRAEMVTLVSELSKRRTGSAGGQLEHPPNTGYPVPSPEPLGGKEMSRAAGRRPGLSAGQLAAATASPLLSLLLLLACCADVCRGKMPPSYLTGPLGLLLHRFLSLPSLPLLWASRIHFPLKPGSGPELQTQQAGEAAGSAADSIGQV